MYFDNSIFHFFKRKQVNGSILIQNSLGTPIQSSPTMTRITHWWQLYQRLMGLDIVEISKNQVIIVQDKLFKCQENRRHLHRELVTINHNLKEIYAELIQTKRDDPKYVQLTIMENKSLQEQNKISVQLNLLEDEEKDHFTQLATAIKEYHDSQATNAQNYKYLSIIASALITIVSLIGSMIYNNQRIANMRKVISEAQIENIQHFSSIQTNLMNSFQSLESLINEKLTKKSKPTPQINTVSHVQNSVEPISTKETVFIFGTLILGVYILGKVFI